MLVKPCNCWQCHNNLLNLSSPRPQHLLLLGAQPASKLFFKTINASTQYVYFNTSAVRNVGVINDILAVLDDNFFQRFFRLYMLPRNQYCCCHQYRRHLVDSHLWTVEADPDLPNIEKLMKFEPHSQVTM